MDFIDIEAKSVNEAIKKALETLKVSRKEVDIKVLSEERRGLFGMQGERGAKIRVSLKKKTT